MFSPTNDELTTVSSETNAINKRVEPSNAENENDETFIDKSSLTDKRFSPSTIQVYASASEIPQKFQVFSATV